MQEKKQKKTKKYSFWERLKRLTRLFYYRLIRIQATPEYIARGLAAGVFIGLLPLIPIQTICALLFAFLLRGSKIAAALGTWVSNPLNWLPLYMAFYYIGLEILPFEKTLGLRYLLRYVELSELFTTAPKLLLIMFVGGLVIAIPSAFITYFIAVRLIRIYQQKRKERMLSKELHKFQDLRKKVIANRKKREKEKEKREKKEKKKLKSIKKSESKSRRFSLYKK